MKNKKTYKKIFKKYKKQLNQINNKVKTGPWEYGFVLEYLITTMNFMKEYYDLGYNVWQSKESLEEIKKTLAETLKAYEELDGFNNHYFHLDDDNPFNYVKTDKGGYYIVPTRPELYEEDSLNKFSKEYKERRDKFFKLLSDNIESWWD